MTTNENEQNNNNEPGFVQSIIKEDAVIRSVVGVGIAVVLPGSSGSSSGRADPVPPPSAGRPGSACERSGAGASRLEAIWTKADPILSASLFRHETGA